MSPNVIGQLVAQLGADIDPLKKALEESKADMAKWQSSMKGRVDSFNTKMVESGKKVKNVGKKMSMYLTTAIVGMGVGAFKLEKDFEASMSKIEGLVGIARDQVQSWGDDIRVLAPQLGKSTKELADAMFFITSAGLRGQAAMDALVISAKASVAGLGETAVVADLVTSAMNAYGAANLSAADAADILTAAVREGKAEAPELTAAMGQILPIASEMQVGFDEVSASIAAMTRTGTDASTASTQLKGILSALIRPTKQAEKAFTEMGTSSADLRKTIRDDGLLKALMDIRKLTNEYGEDAMAMVMPNIRALSGMLDLLGANMEDNIKIFEATATAQGALTKAFEAASDTMEFKWQQALASSSGALQELGKTVGQVVAPILQKFATLILGFTEWMRGLNEGTRKVIVSILALTAAAGPLLMVLGTLMTSVIPKITTGFLTLVDGLGAAKRAFIKLTAVMMTNPYIAIAAAIVAIGGALYIWSQRSKEATEAEKAHQRAQERSIELYSKEAGKISTLRKITENANAPYERRKEAIDELNRIVPAYNASLTKEGELYQHNTTALDNYLVRLKEKYMIQAVEGEYGALIEKQTKALMGQAKAEAQIEEAQKTRQAMLAKGTGTYSRTKEENKALWEANELIRTGTNDLKKYTEEYEEVSTAVIDYETVMTSVMDKQSKGSEKSAAAMDAYITSTEDFQRMLDGMNISELEDTAVKLNKKNKELTEQYRWGTISLQEYTAETNKVGAAMVLVDQQAQKTADALKFDPATAETVQELENSIAYYTGQLKKAEEGSNEYLVIQGKLSEAEGKLTAIRAAAGEELNNTTSIYARLSKEMEAAQKAETTAMTIQEIANARARQDAIQENVEQLEQLADYMRKNPEDIPANFKLVIDQETGMVDFDAMEIPVSFSFDNEESDITNKTRKEQEEFIQELQSTNRKIEKELEQRSMTRLEIIEAEKTAELANFKGTEEDKLKLAQLYDQRIQLIEEDDLLQKKQRQDDILKQIKESGMSQIEWLEYQKAMELELFSNNEEAKAQVAEYWSNRIKETVEQAFVPPESLYGWQDITEALEEAQKQLDEAIAQGNTDRIAGIENYMQTLQERLKEVTSIGGLAASAFQDLGQAAKQAGAQGAASMEEYGKTVLNMLRQIIAAHIAEGVAAAMSKVLKFIPPPFNIPAAAIAGGAAAALFTSLIPSFAEGGVVYGPIIGRMGEYPGASQNPEVIAPLDRLRDLIRDDKDKEDLVVHGALAGDTIYLTNERYGRFKRMIE